MSRFDCNVDSPSCTIPENTGESATGGSGVVIIKYAIA